MRLSNAQWIAWLGSTLVAALTLSAFAFGTFETKQDAKDKKQDLVERLVRIEAKLDRLISN